MQTVQTFDTTSTTTTKQLLIIKRSLLPIWAASRFPPKFISDRSANTADYIAQIIHQLGYPTSLKAEDIRLVSDLKMPIPQFVRICRGKYVQTDLCCNIMQLQPSPESEAAITAMLPMFNIQFIN